MTSAAPWGAIPQAEGVARAIEQAGERLEDRLSHGTEDRSHNHEKLDSSSATDTSSDLEKGGHEITKLAREVTNQSSRGNLQDQKLAPQVTAQSVKGPGGEYPNPFLDPTDPALDPGSGQFKPERWVRTLIGIQSRDPERYPQRVAGIAYKNLNVHGFGSLTDYQKFAKSSACSVFRAAKSSHLGRLATTLLSSFPSSTN